jgi:hypothetical protein
MKGKKRVFGDYFYFFLALKQTWQACEIFIIEDDLEDADVAT